MDETKTWFRRPRYSPRDVVIFLPMVLVAMIIGVLVVGAHEIDVKRNAMIVSPLPDVVAAPSVPTTDAAVYRKQYDFTRDWFTMRVPAWQKVLEPYKGKPSLAYLEVGSYEGRSLIWMLENVLTDSTARATAVDLFDGPFKDRFARNVELSGSGAKVTAIADYSQVALRKLPLDSYDIIYIDGSHFKNDVLEDTVLSWRLLKKGGLMIFDDYREADECDITPGKFRCPKMAIDPFVQCFTDQCEVIHNEAQLIIRKKI